MFNYIRGTMKVKNRYCTKLPRAEFYYNHDCLVDMFKVVMFPLFSYRKDWKIGLKIVW